MRQGLFNVLRLFRFNDSNILDGATVSDVFAGTGALGIEALSNGAAKCAFLEANRSSLDVLKSNLTLAMNSFEKQSIEAEPVLIAADVMKGYSRLPQSRVIFCDPPYREGWFEKIVKLEAEHSRLEKGGVMLFEEADKEPLDPALGMTANLKIYDRKSYGEGAVYFFLKI